MFYVTVHDRTNIWRYPIRETSNVRTRVSAIFKRADGGSYGLWLASADYPNGHTIVNNPREKVVECHGMIWRFDMDGTERTEPFDWERKVKLPLVTATATDQREAM